MEVVCAWCGKSKGDKEPLERKAISWGMCEGCCTKIMNDMDDKSLKSSKKKDKRKKKGK